VGGRPWEQFVKRKGHVTEDQGFLQYVEALKERLTRHGFTRTFELDEDVARQDKLTTWIEYLGYEYWWYDQYSISKRDQQRYDHAWEKLVNSNVLRLGESEEVIMQFDSIVQCASEREEAEEAERSATAALLSAKKAVSNAQQPKLSMQEQLVAAQVRLEETKKRHESIKRRNNLITEFIQQTRDQQIAKRNAERHRILLRWIEGQVPLVEAELDLPGPARKGLEQKDSRRKRKRSEGLDEERRHDDCSRQSSPDRKGRTVSTPSRGKSYKRSGDPVEDEWPSKRRKNNSRHSPIMPEISQAATRVGSKTNGMKGRKGPVHQSSQIPKPLRRSPRIAEREQRLSITVTAPSDAVKRPSRRTTVVAQVPTPPSLVEREAHKEYSETRKRRTRSNVAG
jgi:hypothetical protein